MINWKHGWIIKGGQKYFTSHNEKSARYKNCEVEVQKIEVGQLRMTEKNHGGPPRPPW